MNESNRVFITGLSALTASGNTVDTTWDAILSGNTGIRPIEKWDLSSWSHHLAGELKDFNPAKMLPDRKLIKAISRHDAFGIYAASQAIQQSQWINYRDSLSSDESRDDFNEMTGIFVGSPGNKYFQQDDFLPLLAKTEGQMEHFAKELSNEVHPMWLLRILPNNVLAYTGITYGFKGPNHNITNHAVSGTQAILEAFYAIQRGQIDRAVVVAYDTIEPQALFYYEKLGVISAQHLKPFDTHHNGTILGEGAAALILESEASVNSRAAFCYGEIVGGKSNSEASGLFSIENDGASLANLMEETLEISKIESSQIDFLVAHGNGNQKSDVSEAIAIDNVFAAYKPPVTGFKWSMGHTLVASGLLDAVLTTYSLKNACIPGIANLNQVASSCEKLNLSSQTRTLEKPSYGLMLNRGFASMNACLVIKSCE